jgi:hypothetical protein
MYKLDQKDRQTARELAMKEAQAKRQRDLARAELETFMTTKELWDFLSAKSGFDLSADDRQWKFDFMTAELKQIEEDEPLYTQGQISGWKWRPLG